MTNDNTIDGKKSPALAGQEELNGGLIFSGKVRDFQPNNQTICDGIFAATKRPLSTDITTHVPGFAEAINGTMGKDVEQRQFDAMADVFFNDGAAENDNASPTSYSDSGEFPVWHLPQDLQRVVNVVSSAYNADPVAAWVSMLGVAMACLGKSCRGYFGNGKYLNWPTGWFVLVGMPGTNKSPIIDWFTRYLREEERSAYHRYCQELAQWKSQPKKARRGEEPKHKSLVAENITDERLFQKCCDNNGKLFWLGDEFDGLLGGLVVAHHVAWSPEQFQESAQETMLQVDGIHDQLFGDVFQVEAFHLVGLSAGRTVVAHILIAAVLANVHVDIHHRLVWHAPYLLEMHPSDVFLNILTRLADFSVREGFAQLGQQLDVSQQLPVGQCLESFLRCGAI